MVSKQIFTKDGNKITLEINKDNYPDWAREVNAMREFLNIFNWEENE